LPHMELNAVGADKPGGFSASHRDDSA